MSMMLFTCKELKIAKIHANSSVSSLTASMPIIQVTLSKQEKLQGRKFLWLISRSFALDKFIKLAGKTLVC